MAKRDYYEVLGVTRDATDVSLKKAYKRLALELHPDRNPGNAEAEVRFKECTEAYQVLSDGEKRRLYDRFGHAAFEGPGRGVGDFHDVFSQFQDIFGDFFGGGFGGPRRSHHDGRTRGADLQIGVELTLKEAAFGAKKELDLSHPSPCDACEGTGAQGGETVRCTTCGGRGQVGHARGPFMIATTCTACRGAGSVAKTPCETCKGSGDVEIDRKVKISIPAGVEHGQPLRLTGQGQKGKKGGPPGHLFVTVHVLPDERFHRDGYDLIHELHVSFPAAALGAEVEVPTLDDEPAKVTVPAGIQPGETIVMRGAGIPRRDGVGRGDLVAVVQVDVPKKLSKRAKKLLEELAESLES